MEHRRSTPDTLKMTCLCWYDSMLLLTNKKVITSFDRDRRARALPARLSRIAGGGGGGGGGKKHAIEGATRWPTLL